jgi:DNA-binding CsgD family transcriptional regulator
MKEDRPIPWRRLWDFLSLCSDAEDLADLFSRATREIPKLIPCDQCSIVMAEMTHDEPDLNRTGSYRNPGPRDVSLRLFLSDPDDRLVEAYLGRYFFIDYAMLNLKPGCAAYRYDWRGRRFSRNEFAVDFAIPVWHSHMTLGMPFFAEDGHGGLGLGLSRSGAVRFDDREISLLLALRPHLENLYNLHRRLLRLTSERVCAAELARGHRLLSPREAQIAELLCERMRPAEIAALLLRSRRTVERHIEHIYEKLGVGCRRDMIRLFLSGPR